MSRLPRTVDDDRIDGSEPSEAALIQAAVARDRQAMSVLYQRYRAPLQAVCLARTGRRDMVDDIVHDVFVRAFAVLDRFDVQRPLWPWLAAIARRECIDLHRRAEYAASRREDWAAAALPPASVDVLVLDRLEGESLEAVIARLPVRQRVALRLYALDGWTYAEIAEYLRCPVSTVKALMLRARARMREEAARWLGLVGTGLRGLHRRLASLSGSLQSAIAACLEVAAACVHAAPAAAAIASVATTALVTVLLPPPEAKPLPTTTSGGPADATPFVLTSALGARQVAVEPGARPTEVGDDLDGHPYSAPPVAATQQTAERSANEVLLPLVPGYRSHKPESGDTSMAVSPNYEEDHTVFVSDPGQALAIGSSLFVTEDGGASWQRRRGLGFAGARRFLFPPAYPKDPRLFVLGSKGLQVSRNGGDTFETVVANPSFYDAAIAPAFNRGYPGILLTNFSGVYEYRDDTGVLQPLVFDGIPASDRFQGAWYGDDDPVNPVIVVLWYRPVDLGSAPASTPAFYSAVMSECRRPSGSLQAPSDVAPALRCTETTVADTWGGVIEYVPPATAGPGTAFMRIGTEIHVSRDGGRSFRKVDGIGVRGREAWDLAVTSVAGKVTAFVATTHDGGVTSSFLRSDDAGATWAPVTVDLPTFRFGTVTATALPTGRMLAIGFVGGMACSADGGRSWAATCSSPDTA